jgi:hypothetical protein
MSRRLLVCCALVATVGCGGASPVVPSGPSLNGIWTLHTLNDATLPYRLPYSPNGDPTTVLGARLTMSGTTSGAYTEVIAAHVVTHSGTTDTSLTFSGTWVMNGASITFDDKTFAEVYIGSMTNTSLVKVVLFGYSGEYSR